LERGVIYQAFTVPRGTDAVLRLDIVHGTDPEDLTLTGTKLRITAKLRKADAFDDAVVTKTYDADAFIPSDEITVEGADDNIAVVAIAAEDTADLVEAVYLSWDCLLESDDSGRVTVAYGVLKVPLTVSDPA
jgi:hypothetical protein